MFKKLKDKLAEEVKSSPQRIQQFAQAAQAAVTSTSSSISDITNNDLFSIGDNDLQKSNAAKPHQTILQKDAFQDVNLRAQNISVAVTPDTTDYRSVSDVTDPQRQRRLSNSSFTSDVSFKLPSYECPSMYHLQSDMDVSASEAEERGFGSAGGISLDRVTKEQLYAAYRRTQERYGKYRTQYADLARHYKLLERENAKAKSVLVETQDKALRRISELKEQCALEQSAKAHLETALRVEIEEKNIKIDTLTTKVHFLQNNTQGNTNHGNEPSKQEQPLLTTENSAHLIDLSGDSNDHEINSETISSEVTILNNKIEKMEQLITKYKESLKTMKEKNSQLTAELQVLSKDVEIKTKENEELKVTAIHLSEARHMIRDLKENNEELQNKINTYDFSKTKETSTLEIDLQKAQNEVIQLQSKINIFTKREEDNAISLAENKLSIHKELEGKEAEIKSLKEKLSACSTELQSLSNILKDYKTNMEKLETEHSKINNELKDIELLKNKILVKDAEIQELKRKNNYYEQSKIKYEEEYKCLELQVTQETAEKLAIMDRNTYLENKNKLISEENLKKTTQLTLLENEMQKLKQTSSISEDDTNKTLEEVNLWKNKCQSLELEIQEERVELVKLQSEIEKLLSNYELVQAENTTLNSLVLTLKSDNKHLQNDYCNASNLVKRNCEELKVKISELRRFLIKVSTEMISLKSFNNEIIDFSKEINMLLKNLKHDTEIEHISTNYDNLKVNYHSLEKNLNDMKEQHMKISKEIILLKDEKQQLETKIDEIETDKKKDLLFSEKQLCNVNEQYSIKLNEVNTLKADKELINLKLKDNESKLLETMSNLKESNDRSKLLLKENEQMKVEKETLFKKLQLQEASEKDNLFELNRLKIELETQKKDSQDQKNRNINLEKKYNDLLVENSSLKNNIESIIANFKVLESDLTEVRKSHTEIVLEKDRLNSVIEMFETQNNTHCNQQELLNSAIEENNILKTKCELFKQEKEEMFEKLMGFEQKYSEYERNVEEKQKYIDDCISLRKELSDLSSEHDNLRLEFTHLQDTISDMTKNNSEQEFFKNCSESSETLKSRKTESDMLKEENLRLLSEIEGLQSYMTKISKENSILNDKLREIIASSENPELNETQNIKTLKNDIQLEKEKCDDLIRQNSLLAEENLELKDQLQSQRYNQAFDGKSDNGSELLIIKDKYHNLLQFKDELENKLTNAELVNTSVNSNMNQLHENNQKLRSTNEKLERRLDEALVSLRHLHSLQENTELEYLRNILYEYLTGSGAHSETLAKVLAAVVKFDDKQTQFILQKEKERQGLLRQLGLL